MTFTHFTERYYIIYIYITKKKIVPRVYHWNAYSINRVYLTKTDVSAFASAVVSDYKK